MSKKLNEVFIEEDKSISGAFFASADANEKNWGSVKLLADSDDVTFWTVIANHPFLGEVFKNLIFAIDQAHSSASSHLRHSLLKERELSLIAIFNRLATGTAFPLSKQVEILSISYCVEKILPVHVLPPLALLLLRKSGVAASVIISSLFIICPGYLPSLTLYINEFCDSTNWLALKCNIEMKKGRVQRKASDVLSLLERTYRFSKYLWALSQSSPFIANYFDLARVLRSLRVIVDIISPCLQHFIIASDALKNKRDILSRANYMIANTAISTATILVLFKTYDTNAANEERKWCCPKLVKSAYDNLQEHITQYASGIPRIILGGFKGNIHDLMELFYASNSGSEKQRVGELLLTLTDPITDCKDFEDVAYGARERFTEFLLMDLVHQGFHIDTLLRDEFVDETEARFLGASENVIMQALAGINVEDAPDTNGGENNALQQPKAKNESNDPAVCMVMDVFPHYHVDGIKASLAYYNNDVEQFILDASMENLPPHLISQLTSDENVEEEAAPPGRHQERHLTTVDYDSVVPNGQLFSFLGKDLYDELLGSDDDEEEEDGENEVRYEMADPDYNTGMEDAFNIDESLKYKIRLLNEIMYEDEYDDAQLEDVRQGDVENGDDFVPGKEKVQSSSNAMPENQETKHTPNGPRSDYANKRFHENAAKERRERVKEIKKGREEDKPSYAKKQKTKKNAGGGKNAIARAAKKGRPVD